MGEGAIHLCYFVIFLLLSHKCVLCNEFRTESCASLPDEEDVLSKMKDLTGRSEDLLMGTRHIADIMESRAGTKTWATNLTADQYLHRDRSGQIPFRNPPSLVDSTRLTYPDGECSGWGRERPVTAEPARTKEIGVRQAGDRARSYIQRLIQRIDGFENYVQRHCFDPRGNTQCAGTYYSTHAELKLFASLLLREHLQSDQPRQEALVFAVSREVCHSCRFILPFMMANSGRQLLTISVRDGKKGARTTKERKEYIHFDRMGNFLAYLEGDGEFKCTKVTLQNPPQGVFHRVFLWNMVDSPGNIAFSVREGHLTPATLKGTSRSELHTSPTKELLNTDIVNKKQLGAGVVHSKGGNSGAPLIVVNKLILPAPIKCPIPVSGCDVEELRTCSQVFGGTNLQSICPGSEVMKGIYGSFGWNGAHFRHSLKSVGLICEASDRQRQMGVESNSKFTLECPSNYFLVGIGGCFGSGVDGIWIQCRSSIDGRYWTSGRYGYSTGGCCKRVECPDGLVVGALEISYSYSEIRGMKMCCH